MRAHAHVAVGIGLGLAACASESLLDATEQDTVVAGDLTCAQAAAQLGMDLGDATYRIAPPVSGTYDLDGVHTFTARFEPDLEYVHWRSTLAIDAVIVKAGPFSRVWDYRPARTRAVWTSGMLAPNQEPYPIENLQLCFHRAYRLSVTTDAQADLVQRYLWTAANQASVSELVLAPGEARPVSFVATVTRRAPTDAWSVHGTIVIRNPAPIVATLAEVLDVVEGTATATVSCPVALPYALASGSALTCTYTARLPDGATRTNVATVTTSGAVGGNGARAPIDGSVATVSERDACVWVGAEGAGAFTDRPCATTTYEYQGSIGPYPACGMTERFVSRVIVQGDGWWDAAAAGIDVATTACACVPGAVEACYVGPPETEGVGLCTTGLATCTADGAGFGACVGAVAPGPEVCGDALDNDCDGLTDEDCVDVTPPWITISAPPAQGEIMTSPNVDFTIQTDEPARICWKLDGALLTCSRPGVTSFRATFVNLTAGYHVLTVEAADLAVNMAVATRVWAFIP